MNGLSVLNPDGNRPCLIGCHENRDPCWTARGQASLAQQRVLKMETGGYEIEWGVGGCERSEAGDTICVNFRVQVDFYDTPPPSHPTHPGTNSFPNLQTAAAPLPTHQNTATLGFVLRLDLCR